MAYRKFQADQIFDGRQFIDEELVLITSPGGIIEDVVPAGQAGEDIEKIAGILSPGLVNCHCHLELSHMKGVIPPGGGLVDFVFRIVTERYHTPEEITFAIAKAEEEMARNGIVAVGDICNNEYTIPQKKKQRLHYYNFIESSGWLPSASATRFERSLYLYNQFLTVDTELKGATCSIVPHAPYSVSKELWDKIIPYYFEKPVTIHNQETPFEDEFFLEGTGDFLRMYEMMKIANDHHEPTQLSSLQSYFTKIVEASSAILVHNTFTKQEDIEFTQKYHADTRLSWCICINANQYIENALPPIELLRQNDCTIVLGTDSLASNDSLSLASEMQTIRSKFPHIPLQEVLQWATLNGAKALEMDYLLGSFEKGKQPGVIRLSPDLTEVTRLL